VIIAVIPCFNEQKTIGRIVKDSLRFVDRVIVVDNLSTDGTTFEAADNGADVLTCSVKGAGAATRAGIQDALKMGADIIVTLDGDGQHYPSDIPAVVKPIKDKHSDAVIGSRLLNNDIPLVRRIGIEAINFTYNVGHERITDSQSGFRAFTWGVAKSALITELGFGFSTEFLIKARQRKFRILEIPISCSYDGDCHSMNFMEHGLSVVFCTIKWRIKCLFA
jgi:glycosyltransferase involved in cell wall biosynthesis